DAPNPLAQLYPLTKPFSQSSWPVPRGPSTWRMAYIPPNLVVSIRILPQVQHGFPPAAYNDIPPSRIQDAVPTKLARQHADVINNMLRGKLNCTLNVTLDANATTTTVIDPRISATSCLLFSPLTSNALTVYASLYASEQTTGSATLTHSSSAAND